MTCISPEQFDKKINLNLSTIEYSAVKPRPAPTLIQT